MAFSTCSPRVFYPSSGMVRFMHENPTSFPFINQFKKKNVTKLVLNAKSPHSSSLNNNPEDFSRPLPNYSPSKWGDYFTTISFPRESYVERHAFLKEKVEEILKDSTTRDTVQNIELIDKLCRLGVFYHFESEIEDQLQKMFDSLSKTDFDHYDLSTTSLLFRVFRQHGYKIPCDVFFKFKDTHDGKFKESSMVMDIKGMLSLYEASHVRIHGEDILDEAMAFTTASLKDLLAAQPSHPLAGQVSRALDQPMHRCSPRLEARHYISVYQEDKYRNETLLEFAKVDFNSVQILHREELQQLSIWWKERKSNFPYVRDRIVEMYFFMMEVYFEPHYARARVMLCKFLALSTVLDDTYDAYGTFEELQCLTDAIERWDYSAIDQLPNYMKKLYKILLDYFDEMGKEVAKEGRAYSVYHAREETKNLVRSYFLEAKWYHEGYVPSWEEYIDNALISAGCSSGIAISLVGMKDINEDAFKWVRTKPKIVMGSNAVSRLMDEIVYRKDEKQNGQVASGIEIYVKKYGVTEEEAIEEFKKMLDNAWRDMNEDCLKPTAVPMQALLRALNMSRSIYVGYKHNDEFTNSGELMKGFIKSVLIDPIPI